MSEAGHGGSPGDDAEAELLAPFLSHLQLHQQRIPPSLIQPHLSQLASPDEETVGIAIKSIGCILHNEKIATMFSDESSSMVLLSLVKLITSTHQKTLCNLAIWCLGIQELGTSHLEKSMDAIVQAIVHAIDNPMGSKAITYEALQAVVKMMTKVPKMKMSATIWVPLLYKRLLFADKRDRDMVERCLKDIELKLLPAHPSLVKVVAIDISQTLLARMEKMIASRELVIPAIRAWSWLVRFLGGQVAEKRQLLNRMLKVVEITFVSQDSQVQIASLVAWEALIDAFLECSVTKDITHPETEGISPPSADAHNSHTTCSVKRLKLLMKPLVAIMSSESHQSVKLTCWRTWGHLAHKLDLGINDMLVRDVVASPMFEVIFRSGPDICSPWVWELCLNALYDSIAPKVLDRVSVTTFQHISIIMEGQIGPPKIPTQVSEVESSGVIKWIPWHVDSLESILKFIIILWKCGLENYRPNCDNLSLKGGMKILLLVIKCIENDEKGTLKPSEQHVRSVHSVLMLFGELSRMTKLIVSSEHLLSVLWPVVEVLMNLGSLVLPSSFYKLSFGHPCKSCTILDNPSHSAQNKRNNELITPIVYIIGVWIQLGCTLLSVNGEEVKVLQNLEKLATAIKTDLGIIENLEGIGNLLVQFVSSASELVNGPCTRETEFLQLQKHIFLLQVWKNFTVHLENYLDCMNDIPTTRDGIFDSGFPVIDTFLLFPVYFSLHCFKLPHCDRLERDPKGTQYFPSCQIAKEVEDAFSTWVRLFKCGSRISSLKASKPNLFSSGHCRSISKVLETFYPDGKHSEKDGSRSIIFPQIISAIIVHILKDLNISSFALLALNRKQRFGGFRSKICLSKSSLANEVEDTSNIRDALCIVSRFLDLAWDELPTKDQNWFNSIVRIFESLASFIALLNTQQDVLMFLQELSKTLVKWLCSSEKICISQHILSSGSLSQGLAKVWEKLLSVMEKCQPPLTFDSNLLAIQASLLMPAFQHEETSIADMTLSFWEATYGTRTSFLKYPPCLIPVLNQLKQKVRISLPGWDMQSDKKIKVSPHVDATSRCELSSGQKQLRAFKEQMSLEASKLPVSTLGAEGKATKRLQTSSFTGSTKRVHADHPVDGLLQRIKRPLNASHIHSSKEKGITSTKSLSNKTKDQHVCELPTQEKGQDNRKECDSSAQRKKVRFCGDECVEYVSIPLIPKLPCPLTDHQKEVKRAQQSGGIGMKTYTSMDFSQSQVVPDSEDPQEVSLDIYMNVDEKLENLLSHKGSGSSKVENFEKADLKETECLEVQPKHQPLTDERRKSMHSTTLNRHEKDYEVSMTNVGSESRSQTQLVSCSSESKDVEAIASSPTFTCDVKLQNALGKRNDEDNLNGDTQLLCIDEQPMARGDAYEHTSTASFDPAIESNGRRNQRTNSIIDHLRDIKASVNWECLDLVTLESLQAVLSELQGKVLTSIVEKQCR